MDCKNNFFSNIKQLLTTKKYFFSVILFIYRHLSCFSGKHPLKDTIVIRLLELENEEIIIPVRIYDPFSKIKNCYFTFKSNINDKKITDTVFVSNSFPVCYNTGNYRDISILHYENKDSTYIFL